MINPLAIITPLPGYRSTIHNPIWRFPKSWGYFPNHPVVMDDHDFVLPMVFWGSPKISPEFSDDLQSAIFFSKIRLWRRGRADPHSSPRGRNTAPRRGPRRSAERRYGPSWNAPPAVWPPWPGASPRVWPGTVWAAGEVWERYDNDGVEFFFRGLGGFAKSWLFFMGTSTMYGLSIPKKRSWLVLHGSSTSWDANMVMD